MGWIIVVTWLARLILLALVGMSVYALSIIIERRKFFKENSLNNEFISKDKINHRPGESLSKIEYFLYPVDEYFKFHRFSKSNGSKCLNL